MKNPTTEKMVFQQVLLFLLLLSCSAATSTLKKTTHRNAVQSKILGGWDAEPNKYPFFAYWPDQGCGATLVGPDILLSAAHCYLGDDMGTVWLGSNQVEQGRAYDVVEVWYHPLFNGDFDYEPKYDFLLARINETIDDIAPVKLNTDANIPTRTGDSLVVIGFGSLDERAREYPDALQEVALPYLETEECQEFWDGAITDIELCTLFPDGGMDSCFGDSGGPILTLPDLRQVGIVSWGDGCGRPYAPAVAARVSGVAEDWIRPQVCMKSMAPPAYCDNEFVDLPLTLRVDLLSNEEFPWQQQNISFGLFQLDPPTTLYLVENGVTIINSTQAPSFSGTIAVTSRSHTYEPQPPEETNNRLTSLQFYDLSPGRYYFRIAQQVYNIRRVGTFQHLQVVQGRPSTLQHAWVDLEGGQFEGYTTQYIDLRSNWNLGEVQRPTDMNNPNAASTNLIIDFFYDNAPGETAWELRDLTTDTILVEVGIRNVTYPGFRHYDVEVPVTNNQLQFQIWDAAGDGICCGTKGNGWVEFWDGVGLIWEFDGVFEDTYVHQFSL